MKQVYYIMKQTEDRLEAVALISGDKIVHLAEGYTIRVETQADDFVPYILDNKT